MLTGLDSVDWGKYRCEPNSPDIPTLLNSLLSENYLVRQRANAELARQFDEAYKVGNDLPLVIIPFLAQLLTAPQVPDRLLITDLLLVLLSFSKVDTLPELYRSRADTIKRVVCVEMKRCMPLISETDLEGVREDLDELEKTCL